VHKSTSEDIIVITTPGVFVMGALGLTPYLLASRERIYNNSSRSVKRTSYVETPRLRYVAGRGWMTPGGVWVYTDGWGAAIGGAGDPVAGIDGWGDAIGIGGGLKRWFALRRNLGEGDKGPATPTCLLDVAWDTAAEETAAPLDPNPEASHDVPTSTSTSEAVADLPAATTRGAVPTATTQGAVPTPIPEGAVPTPTTEGAVPTATTQGAVPTATTPGALPAPTTEGAVATPISGGALPIGMTEGASIMSTTALEGSVPTAPSDGAAHPSTSVSDGAAVVSMTVPTATCDAALDTRTFSSAMSSGASSQPAAEQPTQGLGGKVALASVPEETLTL
jgi:hypothetical protein